MGQGMSRSCEVCFSLGRPRRQRVRRLLVAERIVALCEEHAALARAQPPSDVVALRQLFPEETGQRSLVPQRAPLDRRVFPARPEGRRRGLGRRAEDA